MVLSLWWWWVCECSSSYEDPSCAQRQSIPWALAKWDAKTWEESDGKLFTQCRINHSICCWFNHFFCLYSWSQKSSQSMWVGNSHAYYYSTNSWYENMVFMQKRSSFYYATGAAYCISSVLMSQLERYVRSDILIYKPHTHTLLSCEIRS